MVKKIICTHVIHQKRKNFNMKHLDQHGFLLIWAFWVGTEVFEEIE